MENNKDAVDFFLKKDFKFDGEFRSESEGEKYGENGIVTDPKKALERIKSFSPDELKVSMFRDGGSMSVETPEAFYSFKFKNHNTGTYYPYVIKCVKTKSVNESPKEEK